MLSAAAAITDAVVIAPVLRMWIRLIDFFCAIPQPNFQYVYYLLFKLVKLIDKLAEIALRQKETKIENAKPDCY